jgi:RNA polymerase sigma-B factor
VALIATVETAYSSTARHAGRTTLELLRAYHENGDARARETLIEQNLPLVRALAARYLKWGEQLDDLVQVGAVGLIKAVDRFDLDRGVGFSTYATPTILGELKRYFRDRAWSVRMPRRLQEANMRLTKLVDDLTRELKRSPTVPELAKAAELDEEEVLEVLESGQAYSAVSLSVLVGEEDGSALELGSSLGADDPGYLVSEERVLLERGLGTLDSREREIVRLRFFEGLTQSQIAVEVGVSQMHVSRLLRRALERMRDEMDDEDR